MIITKTQFELDILNISEYFKKRDVYEIFIREKNVGLPKLVEMVAYELFINQFDYRNCSDEIYHSYRNVLEFSRELRLNGFVNFK
jgi:hypothetical protein